MVGSGMLQAQGQPGSEAELGEGQPGTAGVGHGGAGGDHPRLPGGVGRGRWAKGGLPH